jgi:hypothetical protein
MRGTHMALLGDPTLTGYIVSPVTNITSSRIANINSVSWTTPSDGTISGFHVYRADSPEGPFYRINSSAIPTAGANANMTFVDPTSIITLKKFTYMVRAVRMQVTPSGRYENFSWGQTVQSKTTNDQPSGPATPGSLTEERFGSPNAAPTAPAKTLFDDSPIDLESHPLDDLGL